MVRFDPVVAYPTPAGSTAGPTPTRTPSPTPSRSAASATPTPTPTGTGWKGWVESNSSGSERTGISSVIVVRVLGAGGYPVHISGGGEVLATCTTGTKPEYGPNACEFGGLWAASYYLWPEGSDIKVSVTMDGIGIAFVNFKAP
jgi:hypothetical protein